MSFCVIGSIAQASPIIRIGEGGDKSWTGALIDGDIISYAGPLSGPATGFYGPASPVPSDLTPDLIVTDDFPESHLSLVMGWDRTGPGVEVASFEFEYDDDPDLNGTMVDFRVYPPPGPEFPQTPVLGFGIELIDLEGESRGWFKQMPIPLWSENHFVFDPTSPGIGLFDFFAQDAGFELTKVMRIRLSVAADPFRPFRDPEPGPPPHRNAWSAFSHLYVVPEPASSAAIAIGIGLLLRRRRK